MSLSELFEKSPWKGDTITASYVHQFVARLCQPPPPCAECGVPGDWPPELHKPGCWLRERFAISWEEFEQHIKAFWEVRE